MTSPPGGSQCFALWVTRNGQHLWAGPFRDSQAALTYLDNPRLDDTGGSIITTGIPMTPPEARKAAPLLDPPFWDNGPLAWHEGTHQGWEEHDGFRRHAHSKNGVITIGPHDSRVHLSGGIPFDDPGST
jgi:hypothetical protein